MLTVYMTGGGRGGRGKGGGGKGGGGGGGGEGSEGGKQVEKWWSVRGERGSGKRKNAHRVLLRRSHLLIRDSSAHRKAREKRKICSCFPESAFFFGQ